MLRCVVEEVASLAQRGEVATRGDAIAAAAGVPLVACVSFATLLAEEIWRRND